MPIQLGSKGEQVLRWQEFLVEQELLRPEAAHGEFDRETDEATREYQERHDLVSDGIVGDLTLQVARNDGFQGGLESPNYALLYGLKNAAFPDTEHPSALVHIPPSFTAADLAVGLGVAEVGASPFDVGAGGGVVVDALHGDDVDGPVELPVAAAVEPVSGGEPGAGGDRGDAGEVGEGGLVAAAAGVGPGAQHGRGHDRADAGLGEQVGPPGAHDGQDRLLVLGSFLGQGLGTTGQGQGAAHATGVRVGT